MLSAAVAIADRCQAVCSFGHQRGKRCPYEATHARRPPFGQSHYRLCYAHAHALSNAAREEPLAIAPEAP